MDISAFIEIAKELHVLGIKITKDGELINEWYSEEECRRNIYSATKSFTSCAVGFAVQEGLISLDEKLTDAFSEDLPEVIDENLQMATVRDLLTMCLGQEKVQRHRIPIIMAIFSGEENTILSGLTENIPRLP